MTSVLPSKEQALFKRVVKCYEQKQYKNGLKFAKQILSNPKYNDHGETLAMKGLILNCLGKRDEAFEHVHRGLKNDVKSYVCWHVYGMLQLFDKKYDEAIKCYRNALRIDQDQVQILKDLSKIQIHVQDFEGFKETRYKLLTLRPTQQNSWIGLALAEHLLNNYDMALDVLQEYVKTQNVTNLNYEHSELLIYQNFVMQEAGKLNEALDHLNKNFNMICDKLFLLENKASLLAKLERIDEAVAIYWELLSRNTDNIQYYEGLEDALKPMSHSDKMHIYEKANQLNSSALLPQKMPLEFTSGAQFSQLLDNFLQKNLRKGVPSLFRAIKNLYQDSEKVNVIQNLLISYHENLEDYNRLDKHCTEQGPESPSTTLWTLILLARHWDYLGYQDKAMKYIDRAISHTPTFIDSYVTKAKIYKHGGDMVKAAELLDESQSMDTADRFINCKCTKYMLRANMISNADKMCSRFTKEGIVPSDDLNDMQCMWYLTESALAYERLGIYGTALQRCHQIAKHFADMLEDQFDFHTYCPRKMTLYSYVKMLKLEDKTLYSNKFYHKAAVCAARIYLMLSDDPSLALDRDPNGRSANQSSGNDPLSNGTAELNASELRKLKNKQRKAEKKQGSGLQNNAQCLNSEQNAIKQQQPSQGDSAQTNPEKNSISFNPTQLVTTSTPLEQALTFLLPILRHNDAEILVEYLAFEIYYRKKKGILMLRALKRMHRLEPHSPQYHESLVRLLHYQRASSPAPCGNAIVDDILKQQLASLYPPEPDNSSLNAYNERFIEIHKSSLSHILSGAKTMIFLNGDDKIRAMEMLLQHYESWDILRLPSLDECVNALLFMRDLSRDPASGSQASSYLERCASRTRTLYPLCDVEVIIDASISEKRFKNKINAAPDGPTLSNNVTAAKEVAMVNGDNHLPEYQA